MNTHKMVPVPIVNKYLSLVKFSHTVFALPFAIIGFTLATVEHHTFSIKLLGLMLLCMVFARSAAMAFNRYADRNFDSKNQRTAIREIPSGTIKASSALAFVIVNCLLFIITAYFINPLCFYLSPLALLVVLGYSYTKRFTALCHLVLGLGLSLAPIGAYLSVTGEFAVLPVLFSLVVLCWVSGFDIIYALQDDDFDKREQLKSIPVLLGRKGALCFSSLLHVLASLLVIAAGYFGNFGIYYWTGAFTFCGFLLYQHLLVKPNDLSKVNMAFFTANGVGSVIFGLLVVIDLLLKK
jgi:4-hydroxybenzoate polyprenyltransferase